MLISTERIELTIMGALPPAPRPRARVMGKIARIYTPSKGPYAMWKKSARAQMQDALKATNAWPRKDDPLSVELVITLPLAKSKHRVRNPVAKAWGHYKPQDCDNLAKGPMDAANGILWDDDRRVVKLTVFKFVCAQGEYPKVEMTITKLEEGVFHADDE